MVSLLTVTGVAEKSMNEDVQSLFFGKTNIEHTKSGKLIEWNLHS